MSNRPKLYKPYGLRGSTAKVPKSTKYYKLKKFPNSTHESTTSSSDISSGNEEITSTSSWVSNIHIGGRIDENVNFADEHDQSDLQSSTFDDDSELRDHASEFEDSAMGTEAESSISDDCASTCNDCNDHSNCSDTGSSTDENYRDSDSDTGFSDDEDDSENTTGVTSNVLLRMFLPGNMRTPIQNLYSNHHMNFVTQSNQILQDHTDSSSSDEDDQSSMSSDNSYEDPSIESIFRNLVEFLARDETNNPIGARCVLNPAEVLLAVLAFAIHYRLSNDGIASLCRMINSFFPSDILPQTKYLLDKLFSSEEGIEYHAMCPECKAYVGKFIRQDRSIHCNICNTRILLKENYRDFFVTFDITQNLRELVESNWEYYISVISGRRCSDGKLRDINDGRIYIEFVRSLPDAVKLAYLTFLCNCDGAAMYKGTKFSLWPIWVIPNEIPIRVRNSNPIPAALWYGHDKPNMTHFLRAFVNRINKLSTIGFSCKIGNEVKCIKAFAICFCVDCMARYAMQGSTIFHGYLSCSWCLHPGVLVPHKTGRAMKFPIIDPQPLPRTELESLWHIQQGVESGPDNFGFQKASPVLGLYGMIITDGFVPDHMHQLDLGSTKQLTEYRIEKRGQPFSFKKSQIAAIDYYLKLLKVPSILERLTRSIYERKIWNSREWENWLLYYSLPILMEIEGYSVFVQHWEHLVGGAYIILKDEIDIKELKIADKHLKTFLFMTEYLYSKDAMSYNVHQTGEHLVQSVANWGPASTHSGYPFEAGNGDLKKKVKAANGVIHQLNRSICRDESLPILKRHVESLCDEEDEESPVLEFCRHLKDGNTQKTKKIGQNRYFRQSSISEAILAKYSLPGTTVGYDKLVRDGCVFQKWTKKQSRSDDSFAVTNDGSFIKIEKFLYDSLNRDEVTVCRRIQVHDISPNAPQIKKIISIDKERVTVATNSILKCCVMMKVNKKRYICPVANMHLY